jgi:outer membrane protein assembly factor BamB
MRWTIAVPALVLAACATGAAAAPPTVRLASAPPALVERQAWTAAVVVRKDGRPLRDARVAIVVRQGGTQASFRARSAGPGRYQARVVFPYAARWTVSARVGTRTYRLTNVTVAARIALREPFAIDLTPGGNLVIANGRAHNVVEADASGGLTVLGGNGRDGATGDDGAAADARIGFPIDLAVDLHTDVYVVTAHRVRLINYQTGVITTFAGTGENGYSGDGGPATAARLGSPIAVAVGPDGDLYIAEHAGRIRRVDHETRVITTFAGIGREESSGDGGPATAAGIDRPHGLAVAADGTVYVSDTYGNRIRRIDARTGIITTVAGPEGFLRPIHVNVAPDGSLYVDEHDSHRVRRIDPGGRVTTVAGTGLPETSGDGGAAASAGVNGPSDVAVAADGTVYIAELDSARIRRVDPRTGVITTFVG